MRTWHEAQVALLQMMGASLSDGSSTYIARSAIQEAQQHLLNERDWKYHNRFFHFNSVAKQTSSTITYDHTGGSSERLVTIAAGTWPTWALYGILFIDSKMHRVQTRLSDTTLQLTEEANPGADVAAGTTYVMYQEAYSLPVDFSSLYKLNRVNDYDPTFVLPHEFEGLKNSQEYYGQPRNYTIMADPHNVNLMAVWFYPGPDSLESYQCGIQRRPLELRTFDENAGTIAGTLGSASVTGTGTAFDSSMVGAVLRIGSTTEIPEGLENGVDVYKHEAIITAVANATALTIDTVLPDTYTASKIRISSRLSVDDGSLYYALLACARWRFRDNSQAPISQTQMAERNYEKALNKAGNQDGMQHRGGSLSVNDPVLAAFLVPQVTF